MKNGGLNLEGSDQRKEEGQGLGSKLAGPKLFDQGGIIFFALKKKSLKVFKKNSM